MMVERLRLAVEDAPVADVTAVIHRPGRARGVAVLLAPGAGGDLDGDGLVALANVIADGGHLTVRINLPYRESGKGGPPKAERSAPHLAAILAAARGRVAPRRGWVVGGKSYGGRVASLAVADGLDADGLLFYGYPLHPPGKPERLRVEHWPRIGVPALFLQGTNDPFCDLTLLEEHRPELGGPSTLLTIDGGDHSLQIAGTRAPDGVRRSASEVFRQRSDEITRWLSRL
ncbi:MAG: hypothetical protein KY469_18440 [Actinobacteria bacterium]|nr:hypothetical protein [Actinomycetota bacterium]